jgi:plastocyanin
MQRRVTPALLTAGILLGSGCGGSGGTNPPPPPPPPPPPSATMAKASPSGDAQSGAAGTVLTNPLRVSITQNGAAAAGRTVTWGMEFPNNGSVTATSVTGADGIATATVTLPGFATTSTILATSAGATNSPLSFTAISTGAGLAVTVNVVNTAFQPAQFQLKQGGRVTFLWGAGSGPHTVTPDPPNTIPSSGVGNKNAPFSFEVTFPALGAFRFFCEVHGAAGGTGMSGTITVVP